MEQSFYWKIFQKMFNKFVQKKWCRVGPDVWQKFWQKFHTDELAFYSFGLRKLGCRKLQVLVRCIVLKLHGGNTPVGA